MRVSTAFAHQERLLSRVRDLLGSARWFGMTHADCLTRYAEIQADPAFPKLPAWAQARVRNAWLDGMDALYRPMLYGADLERAFETVRAGGEAPRFPYLRWALFLDGKEVTSDEVSASGRWAEVTGAHVWNQNGTPFSPPENVGGAK